MLKKLLFTFSLTFLIVGCGSTPKQVIQPFDKSITVEAEFDETWTSLVRFFSTNDVSISTIEKDSGIIQLEGERLSADLISKYCAVDLPWLWTLSSGGARGSVLVADDDGFVSVDANLRFTFTAANYVSNPPQFQTYNCESTGVLETAILNSAK